jgi:hypothetical protein
MGTCLSTTGVILGTVKRKATKTFDQASAHVKSTSRRRYYDLVWHPHNASEEDSDLPPLPDNAFGIIDEDDIEKIFTET